METFEFISPGGFSWARRRHWLGPFPRNEREWLRQQCSPRWLECFSLSDLPNYLIYKNWFHKLCWIKQYQSIRNSRTCWLLRGRDWWLGQWSPLTWWLPRRDPKSGSGPVLADLRFDSARLWGRWNCASTHLAPRPAKKNYQYLHNENVLWWMDTSKFSDTDTDHIAVRRPPHTPAHGSQQGGNLPLHHVDSVSR